MRLSWLLSLSPFILSAQCVPPPPPSPPVPHHMWMPEGTYWSDPGPCCDDNQPPVDNIIYDVLNPCCARYVWLPEAPPIFIPFKADPRQLQASVGLRFGDTAFGSPLVDVSYFDTIPMIRFFNVFSDEDQLELDVEGALWAVFLTFKETAPLVNADYFIGGSINYCWDKWSFRFRIFHISSHIGDEFMILHPTFHRKNPSAEYVDLYASYVPTAPLRLYAGLGYIPIRDPSYRVGRFYASGGVEYYLPCFQWVSMCHMITGSPYIAANLGIWEFHGWDLDQTYVLGYEFAKLYGLERKLRAYIEYHNGYSAEGQFCHLRTQYFSVRVSYGF